MADWIQLIRDFLAEHWLVILVAMLVLYYTYHYLMLVVSVAIFPLVVVGSGIWSLNTLVEWPRDEVNRLSPGNFFFFLAGTLAFLIEIWLFSLFLEYYLLGESIMPIAGNIGVRMSVVSGIGFGMLSLIFGHLAHHLLGKDPPTRLNIREDGKGGTTMEEVRRTLTPDRVVGLTAAFFFFVATLVLGYSGGLRAYTLANAVEAGTGVVIFSVLIGAIFGFMMPFGAVVGMSRGGFLWYLVRNILLGIPLMVGMMILIVAAFVYFLFEIILNLVTLPISKLYSIIGGICGINVEEDRTGEELTGWRIGVHHLVSSAEPPRRLRLFLDHTRERLNFWDVEEKRAA